MSASELAAVRAARPDVTPVTWRVGERYEMAIAPCPYLAATGDCSVYAVRPWRCRVFACFRRDHEYVAPLEDDTMTRRLVQSAGVRRGWLRMLEDAEPWGRPHGWVDERGDAEP